jgi:hypothetical protein
MGCSGISNVTNYEYIREILFYTEGRKYYIRSGSRIFHLLKGHNGADIEISLYTASGLAGCKKCINLYRKLSTSKRL